MTEKPETDFEKATRQASGDGLVREFWDFLRHNKKWWLLPVLVVVFLLGFLILLSGSAAAPFIYTLF
jgi:Family of unknown function (DUF5989)